MTRNSYSTPLAVALALLALILGAGGFVGIAFIGQSETAALDDSALSATTLARPGTGATVVNDNDLEDLRATVHTLSASKDEALRELRSQLDGIRQEQARIYELMALSNGSQDSHNEIRDLADLEEMRDRKRAAMNAQFERLETRFGAEIIDREWAVSTQREIEHALLDAEVDMLHQVSVDCRTTFCRLEVPGSIDGGDTDGIQQVREVLTWPGESFYQREEDTGTMVGYLVRDGQSLWEPTDSR